MDKELTFELIDLKRMSHITAFKKLLSVYMIDEMGSKRQLYPEQSSKVVQDLMKQSNYCGFLVKAGNEYIAMANCFINYSTFRGKQLLNIHDYIVTPEYRQKGVGSFLMDEIIFYCESQGYCRINLEVREDNFKAQGLYKKSGFKQCDPNMFFWERNL
ncbi:GNAT family N-acetyltransferase [Saccharicrinis sp. FJH62]|uniref:GNAT family N-acetyltransferase n=1 Tax=Saccharicrinis sp. FJH62 TaxID=3344657 RepID=UPI0035D48407